MHLRTKKFLILILGSSLVMTTRLSILFQIVIGTRISRMTRSRVGIRFFDDGKRDALAVDGLY